jgi:hypothetical protein
MAGGRIAGMAELLRYHFEWQPSQAQMAAVGGADRRSAKNAAKPMHQSREAHHPARPLHPPKRPLTALLALPALQVAMATGA